MEAVPYIAAFWLSASIMLFTKTYSRIVLLVDMYQIKLIQKYRVLHLVVYGMICLVIAPFLWKVILFDNIRDGFINEYCKALNGKK